MSKETKKLKKLQKLNRKAQQIVADDSLTWDEKYSKVFSDKISTKVFDLTKLEYWDPDTTYEEDTCAFVNALDEHVKELENKPS